MGKATPLTAAARLMLTSTSHAVGACHQGAAIEGLCLTNLTVRDQATSYTTFYHNVSSQENKFANANDALGTLIYVLRAGLGLQVPSAMFFHEVPDSNMADLIFKPGYSANRPVAFDSCGSLYIPGTQNNTVSPPEYYEPELKVKNWYICLTRFSYLYESLVWKIGVTGEPQNPTCQSVGVQRVWV